MQEIDGQYSVQSVHPQKTICDMIGYVNSSHVIKIACDIGSPKHYPSILGNNYLPLGLLMLNDFNRNASLHAGWNKI